MDGHGIPQVSPGATGIHLSWCGPAAWVYAPTGFTIQRRPADREDPLDCERLDSAAIADLRVVRERRLPFGTVTLRDGTWLDDLDGPGGEAAHTPTEVFRVDLDADHRVARVAVSAKLSFVVALHGPRVVGVSGPVTGTATHLVRAPRLDTVVVHTLSPGGLQVCVDLVAPAEEEELWRDVPPLVSGLTLPFRELMPSLLSDADELAEARSRLLPGEQVEEEAFARLATAVRPLLRAMAGGPAPPRPADLALLLREQAGDEPDEARALDPVRMMLAHPTWRRALGFAWFDDDPALVVGASYDYRITATYPSRDVLDRHHGFATVPSGTLLPADFALGGPRVRVPRPVAVEVTATDGGRAATTRRGIRLDPTREPHWLGPGLDDWSLVVDFPTPVEEVVLDLEDGHDLVFGAGSAFDPFDLTDPVPAGPRPRLALGGPAQQLRLRGRGVLHGWRVPVADDDKVQLSVVLPPVALVDTPLPAAPLSVTATSLQQPAPAPTDPVPDAEVPHRHGLGFTVAWRPAPAFGLTAWPPDLDASVPLDATVFEVERTLADGSAPPDWEPVVPEQNWTVGDRGGQVRDLTLAPGADLMAAFPEQAVRTTGADLDLTLVDTLTDPDTPPVDGPRPGTVHRYRVRAVDAVGRPSATWRETDPVRLEKHVPPPVPVGPSVAPGPDEQGGVQARVLVRDADDLTDDERSLLGDAGTAVLLRWGWHADQRAQDPFATEFRVYVAPPLDVVTGTVTGVTTTGAGRVTSYRLDLALDRPVPADLAAGLRLDAGHPFFIRSHTAGTSVTMDVETRLRVLGAPPVPATGPISLRLPLTPDRTRPPAWGAREAVVPVTDETSYEVVLRDRLVVGADEPVATLWVGVSSADDQEYVADQLAPAGTRPGNESAIVPVLATARYAGRPDLEVPPPLAPVPVVLTPEPTGEPVLFTLDLTPFLPAEALASPGLRTERVAANGVVAACTTTADGRVLGRPVDPRAAGDVDREIVVPNPDDRAALVAALEAGSSAGVEDRFVVFLAGHHPYRDRLFEPADDGPVAPGPVPTTLPPVAQRWVFRVRAADAAGHLSSGGATAAVVVRVPSLAPPPPPTRLPREPDDPPSLLRAGVPADSSITHLLVFAAPSSGTGPVAAPELLRVPNRPDLHPTGHLWLRSHDGSLLAPTATPLDDPSVVVEDGGTRTVPVTVPGDAGARTRVWLATVNRDGVPSEVAGPSTVALPPPPLPVPTLVVTGDQAAWTWAPGVVPPAALLLALERLHDGAPAWRRVSPMLDPAAGSTTVEGAPGTFRLRVTSPDGRSAHSEPVTV